jgi:hypothetical protein
MIRTNLGMLVLGAFLTWVGLGGAPVVAQKPAEKPAQSGDTSGQPAGTAAQTPAKDPIASSFELPSGATPTEKQTEALRKLREKYEPMLREAFGKYQIAADEAEKVALAKQIQQLRQEIQQAIQSVFVPSIQDKLRLLREKEEQAKLKKEEDRRDGQRKKNATQGQQPDFAGPSAGMQPEARQPAVRKPAARKPVVTKPAATQPVHPQPAKKPVAKKPTAKKPASKSN